MSNLQEQKQKSYPGVALIVSVVFLALRYIFPKAIDLSTYQIFIIALLMQGLAMLQAFLSNFGI